LAEDRIDRLGEGGAVIRGRRQQVLRDGTAVNRCGHGSYGKGSCIRGYVRQDR
jgi:hypothetical protein